MVLEPKTSVPGLARGIVLLRILADGRSATLDDFARLTGYPKSSILRQLDTLQAMDLIARDMTTNLYFALQRLVPMRMPDQHFDLMINAVLGELARMLDSAAEWYVPVPEGLVLVRRIDPQQHRLQEMAQIGYVRRWNWELEAVSTLGYAWHEDAPELPSASENKLCRFVRNGVVKPLSLSQARAAIEAARERGYVWDPVFNDNSVRRVACIVLHDKQLLGVLAVAERQQPGVRSDILHRLLVLTGKAKLLSQYSSSSHKPLFNPMEIEQAVRSMSKQSAGKAYSTVLD